MPRFLLLAALLPLSVPAFAETEIAMVDVPEKVLDTAIATAPGVDFTKVSTETENGVTIYEFEAKGPDGKHIEIDVREDGSLEEIEMETSLEETPDAVRNALEASQPGFSASYVETSVRGSAFVYEIEGTTAEGVFAELEISEDGEILSVSDGAES